ncbi:MAG: OmpA family protein [Myxococcales bacterium]|nr:OmpA family protein [Myxococcales bacterium]
MKSPLWAALALAALACSPPPRPAELKTFEALRTEAAASRIETRQPELFGEAQAQYRAALAAYEDDRDVDASRHHATLAALTWETALARSQQMDHQDALTAARHRMAVSQEALGEALRRATVAQDAIGQQERLIAMQGRLVEMERKARRQHNASKAKAQIDAAAVELKAAEGLAAARHAPEAFAQAQAAMSQAMDAFEGGNYPEADAFAQEAWRAAQTAAGVARPKHEAEVATRKLAARLAALVEAGAALPGAEAHLEARGVVVRLRALFGAGEDALTPEHAASLAGLVTLATDNADLRIVVEGHTDNRGQAKANLALSEARAKAVAAHLVAAGVAADRVAALGRGDEAPIADNAKRDGRALNRRVEVVFIRPQ